VERFGNTAGKTVPHGRLTREFPLASFLHRREIDMLSKVLMAGFALALAVPQGALARNYTQEYSDEQRQACEQDALKLCQDDVPDVDKIIACMQKKKAQLSHKCLVVFVKSQKPK
jgi:hypothetical protein